MGGQSEVYLHQSPFIPSHWGTNEMRAPLLPLRNREERTMKEHEGNMVIDVRTANPSQPFGTSVFFFLLLQKESTLSCLHKALWFFRKVKITKKKLPTPF